MSGIVRTWPQSKAPKRKAGAQAWVLLRIRTSATSTGTYGLIDTQAWSDPDPHNPQPIDIETQNGIAGQDWAQFQWQDVDGDVSDWSSPVYKSGMEIDAVAALCRARTRDSMGNELGTFTDDTRPTAQGVADLYTSESALVGLSVGNLESLTCPNADQIRTGAMQVIAKRVAAIIEASYRPDELAQGRTVADFYDGDRTAELMALEQAASSCRAYQPGDPEGGSNLSPVGYFPPVGVVF